MPDQAVIHENGNTAFIVKSHLKVLLETDYLALQKSEDSKSILRNQKRKQFGEAGSHQNESTKNAIREIILPILEKEVNEGKNFAQLRQVFSGMILATWYKKALKESLLGKVYADKAKVKGVDLLSSPKSSMGDPEAIYQQYLQAFKKGVYNYVKEEKDKYTNQSIPRKYFAGGFVNKAMAVMDRSQVAPPVLRADLAQVGNDLDAAMADLSPKRVLRALRAVVRSILERISPVGSTPASFLAGRVKLRNGSLVPYEEARLIFQEIYSIDTERKGEEAKNGLIRLMLYSHRRDAFHDKDSLKIAVKQLNGTGLVDKGKVKNYVLEVLAASYDQHGMFDFFLRDPIHGQYPKSSLLLKNLSLEEVKAVLNVSDALRAGGNTPVETVLASIQNIQFKEIVPSQITEVIADDIPLNIVLDKEGNSTQIDVFSTQLMGAPKRAWQITFNDRTEVYVIDREETLGGDQTSQVLIADAAMSPYGGIDMNAANMDLIIKRDGKGVPLPIAQQDMAQLSKIEGFVPNIIEIRPVMSLPVFKDLIK